MTPKESTSAVFDRWIDPAVLMRISSLELRARTVVEGFLSGLNRSPYHGYSVEFTEYREYQPGDDLRYLDWKLYARSERRYLRRFEDETNLCCHLLLDLSSSMQFGSLGFNKSEYANTVAATLACFLMRQRDAVGLVAFDDGVRDYIPARFAVNQMRRILVSLIRHEGRSGTNLAGPVATVTDCVQRRGLVVLISDLLFESDSLRTHCGYLRARGHDVIVLQVLDPAELQLDLGAAIELEDLETGQRMMVDPGVQAKSYQRRFDEHQQSIQRVCQELGIEHHVLATNQPLEHSLEAVVRRREKHRAGGSPQSSDAHAAPGHPRSPHSMEKVA